MGSNVIKDELKDKTIKTTEIEEIEKLTVVLFFSDFLLAYLFPTAEKGTWEFRKKNQRLT